MGEGEGAERKAERGSGRETNFGSLGPGSCGLPVLGPGGGREVARRRRGTFPLRQVLSLQANARLTTERSLPGCRADGGE